MIEIISKCISNYLRQYTLEVEIVENLGWNQVLYVWFGLKYLV